MIALQRSYSSELLPSCSEEASRSPTPLYDRIASPVYATPWTNYPLIQKSDCGFEQRPRPLIVRNKSSIPLFAVTILVDEQISDWQQPNIVYAQPYRGPMIQPHVAERQFEQPNSYFNRKMRWVINSLKTAITVELQRHGSRRHANERREESDDGRARRRGFEWRGRERECEWRCLRGVSYCFGRADQWIAG